MSDQSLLDHLWQTVGEPSTVLTRAAFCRVATKILQRAAEWQRTQGERAMTPMHTGGCDRCGASWTFLPSSSQWLWKERSGAAHLLQEYGELPASGPEPLSRCPCCKAKLEMAQPVGKARVEEVKGE